ncbi:MAG: hypothetical protein MI754_13585 [Chromatiales bacterium]|nr:hypothetical protein [Chromatiales bacterium]
MNHSRRTTRTLLLPVMAFVATTAACAPIKDDYPDYSGGADYDNDLTIDLCQDAVVDKIKRQRGYSADVQFGTPDIYQASKKIDTVEGKGTIRESRRYTHFDYSCDVNIRSDRVLHADIDYRHSTTPQRLVRICHDSVRERAQNEIGPRAQVTFQKTQTKPLSSRTTKISGEYDISHNNRTGKMRYSCKVDTKHHRLDSLTTRWIEPLSGPAINYAERCHQAVTKKVERNGGRKVNIRSTQRTRSKNKLDISGKATFKQDKQKKHIEYACHINTRKGRLESVNYRFKPDQNSGGTGATNNRHIESLCKNALARHAHSLYEPGEGNIFFQGIKSAKYTKTKTGMLVKGKVSLRVAGIPQQRAFTCNYSRAADKIIGVNITYP